MMKAKERNVTKGKRRVGQTVGYLRVSALDQKELRQLEGIELDKRFTDKASGKEMHRPQLQQLMEYVREGDTVVCHAMDRLARNLDDLRKIVLGLTERGVHVRFEKENLTFTGEDSPMSHLLLSVMGAFAQFERDLIRERQREGIALAKLRERRIHRAEALSQSIAGQRATAACSSRRVEDGASRRTGHQSPNPLPVCRGSKEVRTSLQRVMHCPCGNAKVLALGLCSTCYTLKRQDEEHFGGLREAVLERDGHRCRVCDASGPGQTVHHCASSETRQISPEPDAVPMPGLPRKGP